MPSFNLRQIDRRVYAALAALFLLLLLLMPRSGRFTYDYRKGMPWEYPSLVAQFDFPVLKTADQMLADRQAAMARKVSYFRFSDDAVGKSMHDASSLDFGDRAFLKQPLTDALSDILSRGVAPDGPQSSPEDAAIYVQRGKQVRQVPAAEIFTVSSASAAIRDAALSAGLPGVAADSVLAASGVYALVVPTLIPDEEAAAALHGAAADVSPTQGVVKAGQLIVSEGETVTAEIQQLLDSYAAEYSRSLGYSGPPLLQWLGNALLALLLVAIYFFSVLHSNPDIFSRLNRFLYLTLVFAIASSAALMVARLTGRLVYMIPFPLAALYMLAFFRRQVVLPVYTASLMPLVLFSSAGVELFFMFMAAGIVTIAAYRSFGRGWKQFVLSLMVFATLAAVFFTFRLVNDERAVSHLGALVAIFIGSLLPVAGYPLIYLFEKLFNLVSESRLAELCDTNSNTLLRELSLKAPGTFQHSLQVMNMADAAARAIGADVLLVRAGALYHDIGKMANPACFIENGAQEETGYHDRLSPLESSSQIIRHVEDGLEMASRQGLPDIVKSFIATHHGTTTTAYFLDRHLKAGGDPSEAALFAYPGPKPVSREEVILMICDTLEAASRTLKGNSPEVYDAFVEDIFASKISADQFDGAEISLKELGILKAVLKKYLSQLYHGRVAYPKNNQKTDKQ